MEMRKKCLSLLSLAAILLAVAAHYALEPWGFYWKVGPEEAALRMQVVATAQQYLGCKEADGSHQRILDRYNAHKPLAMGYEVQYTDSWCSTFVSAVSIECGLTEIFPTECGCQRHIELFRKLGRWVEYDHAIPLPGDLIFYDWEAEFFADSTGWSDHVGIVVGTKWPFVKVIEGNREDQVMYRILPLGHYQIRGYARPDYASMVR